MIRNNPYRVAFLSVILLAIALTFSGVAAAEESSLEEMEGEGTEDDPYVITDVEELQAMNEDRHAHYVLGNDIDASDTQRWNAGAGFDPIGSGLDDGNTFSGSFDGRNHTITDLTIDRPDEEFVGLFGTTRAPIENVHLEDADIEGYRWVAPLAGWIRGDVRYASATGQVEGHRGVSGLVAGIDEGSTVERGAADADITADWHAGGLVGDIHDGRVIESYARGTVESDVRFGGGLVGDVSRNGEVRLSYASGDTSSGNDIGGLAGRNVGLVSDTFAVGEVVSDTENHGGLTGRVLVDDYDARVANSYWDIDTTGQTSGTVYTDEGIGLRTREMTGAAAERNMEAFDFEYFWTATDEYPVLRWQVRDVSVSLEDSTVTEGDRTGVTVTLTLDDGSTVTASEVADYGTDGGAAVDAGVVETTEQGTTEITATVAGESDTASLEITEPPNIELADASLAAPAVVNDSETAVPVTATYANDGGPGAHTAELLVDGEAVASERVWVGADDETSVELAWTPDGDAGTEYEVAIDDTDLGTLTVVDAETVSLESVSVPERVGSGASYEVAADLASDHDAPVLASVAYDLEGERLATESVAVDPDGSTTDFERESDADAGSTLAHAVALDGETVEATSEVAEPPAFEITALETPDEAAAGEEFELTATIENAGGLAGSQQVVVSADGGDVGATDLALEADSSGTVSIPVTEDEAAEYEYTVATDDDERTATVAVDAAEESTDGSGSDDDGSDGLPGFTTGVTVVALLATVIAARRQ